MYRAAAIKALETKLDLQSGDLEARLKQMLDRAQIHFDGQRIMLDGRDVSREIGAPAISEVRARRRYVELAAKRVPTTFNEVLQQLRERDVRDRGRALAPLKRADDAVLIDCTNLDADQVVNQMKSLILAGGNAGKGLKRN